MDRKFVPPKLKQASRRLRMEATPAENHLWEAIRDRRLNGAKFRRQHVIAPYVVDFYCSEAKVIVELDGSIHDEPEVNRLDNERQQILESQGYLVLRFRNDEVLSDLNSVLVKIGDILADNLRNSSTKNES